MIGPEHKSTAYSTASILNSNTYDAKVREPSTGRYRPALARQISPNQLILEIPGGLAAHSGQVVEVAVHQPGACGLVRRYQMVRALIRQISDQGCSQELTLRLFRPLRIAQAA